MSGSGAPEPTALDGSSLRVALVASRWHAPVTDGLLAGAHRGLAECSVSGFTEVRVPGAFELPVAAARLAADHDAIIALGVVIRGGTPHFDFVCQAATMGLTDVAQRTGVPIGFGVLTCENEAQALDRAGLADSREDKGREAALAAIETALTLAGCAPRG